MGNPYKLPICLGFYTGSFKNKKNYFRKKKIFGFSTAVQFLSSSPGAHSRMKFDSFLVFLLLDIIATCPPCYTPLLTKFSWMGGNFPFSFRVSFDGS